MALLWSLAASFLLVAPPPAPAVSATEAATADGTSVLPALSSRQRELIRDAVSLARKHKYEDAFRKAKSVGDPAAIKLVEWFYVQSPTGEAGLERIAAFMADNPLWPDQARIRRRAELAAYVNVSRYNPDVVIRHFRRFPPETGTGEMALALAYLRKDDRQNAVRWARLAWRESYLSSGMERRLMANFGKSITRADRHFRLSRLIHMQRTEDALRAAKYLPKSYQTMASAAVALIRESKGALARYAKVPASLRRDPCLQYAYIRWHRRQDKGSTARKLLLRALKKDVTTVEPNAWWVERRLLARDALRPDKPRGYRAAYRLVTDHGFESGSEFVEAEFLAGWISLSFLKDAATALGHFRRLRGDATLPGTISRAEYWIGRSYTALDKASLAQRHYMAAAVHASTYYGQLARDRLGLAPPGREFTLRPGASQKVRERLAKIDAVRAIGLLAATGDDYLMSRFFVGLAHELKAKPERAVLAELSWHLRRPHLGVKVANVAERYGHNLGRYGYPTSALPQFKPLVPSIDRPLVFGVARQESQFFAGAVSHAGARGLMQIMPATAKMIAKDYRHRYSKSRLVTDPAYNLQLGSAFLHDLLKYFDGSYIMAIAGYNAGPGRPRDWAKRFGDPRSGDVDPIDWVESIPFTETRKYVQKVMENLQVYRTILTPRSRTTLTTDLHRGAQAAAALGGATSQTE